MSTGSSVHTIIHSAASSAADAAAGLAQVPGSDNAVIMPIQVSMIMAIATVHDKNLDRAAALGILSSASAGVAGRALSQSLVGWIPGFGNALNATTAFGITETIGWSADKIISEG